MTLSDHGVFVVSDGVGGHNAGNVASGIVVDTLARSVRQQDQVADECWLYETIQQANANVHDAALSNACWHGMGATVVTAWIRGDWLTCFHVGDSRAYRVRDLTLERLTRDHALICDESVPRRKLTRALGINETVSIEVTHHDWRRSDTLLLVSDGISDPLTDPEIAATVLGRERHGGEQVAALVHAAQVAGGQDDKTVVMIRSRTS